MFTPLEIISWQTFSSPRRQASQNRRKSSLRSSGFSSFSCPDEMACASVARAASSSCFFLTSIVANANEFAQLQYSKWPSHLLGGGASSPRWSAAKWTPGRPRASAQPSPVYCCRADKACPNTAKQTKDMPSGQPATPHRVPPGPTNPTPQHPTPI